MQGPGTDTQPQVVRASSCDLTVEGPVGNLHLDSITPMRRETRGIDDGGPAARQLVCLGLGCLALGSKRPADTPSQVPCRLLERVLA